MKLSQTVKVKNAQGLHARPASVIARLLQKRQSKVFFSHHTETINARSIMNLLMLGAHKDAEILINVEGDDAQETMDSLIDAFEDQFGETANEI